MEEEQLNYSRELDEQNIVESKKETKLDSFINKTSLWIWFYVIALIILSIYPVYYLLDITITTSLIQTNFALSLTEDFKVKTFIVVSYLIYPVVLLILDVVPLFFLKRKENIKLYLILSSIFIVSFLVSFIICLFNIVILPLKQ